VLRDSLSPRPCPRNTAIKILATAVIAWGTAASAAGTAPTATTQPATTQPAPRSVSANADTTSPRAASAWARLKEPTSVDFQATKLTNAIDFIRNRTGLNVFVNWPELQKLGIEPDAAITMNLRDVAADIILRRMLEMVSESALDNPVTFTVEDEIVMISTKQELAKHTFVRVYDVRDLLHAPVTGGAQQEPGLRNAREVGSGTRGSDRR